MHNISTYLFLYLDYNIDFNIFTLADLTYISNTPYTNTSKCYRITYQIMCWPWNTFKVLQKVSQNLNWDITIQANWHNPYPMVVILSPIWQQFTSHLQSLKLYLSKLDSCTGCKILYSFFLLPLVSSYIVLYTIFMFF